MSWTKERPTKPGLYVVRTETLTIYPRPILVSVFLSKGELLSSRGYNDLSIPVNNKFYDNYEWLGPLPE